MKKKFLENWRGSVSYGRQNQWKRAQGSSLEDPDLKILDAGYIVKRSKDRNTTKVFVRDEERNLWSVIVNNLDLTTLENELIGVGYKLVA